MEVLYDTREKTRQEDTTYIENIAIAFCTKIHLGWKHCYFVPRTDVEFKDKKKYNGFRKENKR